MITHPAKPTNPPPWHRNPVSRWATAAALVLLAGLAACEEDPVDEGGALCGGDIGVGMRVEGRADPLEVCVSDADVSALVTAGERYDIAANMHTDDGVFQVRMVFQKRDDFPVTLRIVDTLSEAISDPGAVWLHYEEAPVGSEPIASAASEGGRFRLSSSNLQAASGFFENVTMTMEEIIGGAAAGERLIVRGEFSVSAENPARLHAQAP